MVVVLWSDHGQNVGEHGTWCKMAAWEHSLRVAMMIKPAAAYPGSRSDSAQSVCSFLPDSKSCT